MALKFVFSVIVLMNLKICVTGLVLSPGSDIDLPRLCMAYVNHYHKVAEGFADEDATEKDLEVAIRSIIKAYWKWKEYDYSNRAWKESEITTHLKQCYGIRKVKYIWILPLNTMPFILLFGYLGSGVHTTISTNQDLSVPSSSLL